MNNIGLWLGMSVLLGAGCGVNEAEVLVDEGELLDTTGDALKAAPFFAGDPANGALFATDISFWETPMAQSQMDCFWDSGVRHVVVGTQRALITRQQLEMAVSRGMTVDAYVYLYWDMDIAQQVETAFTRAEGFPIGTMWLDIEQEPGGRGANELMGKIRQSLQACEARGLARCGIYTGPGWWKTWVNNTTAFSAVPLWYAQYDRRRSLSDWSTQHFGGWVAPAGKQFQSAPLCGAGGADWNVMQVAAQPTVVVDRTLPPDTHLPPVAPKNLFPDGHTVEELSYVKLMSGTVPRATQYQLALERYTGTRWLSYFTWTKPDGYVKVSPPKVAALYRFRARAQNAWGWGAWSEWATFDFGRYSGPRPTAQ